MQNVFIRMILSMVRKEALIGFIAGTIITAASGMLGMSTQDVKRAVCSAPEVIIPN